MRSHRLKFVASISAGQSPPGDEVFDQGTLPFLQGCAEFGQIHPTPTKFCDSPPKLASRDSWLISVRAPVGELNCADCDYGIGRGLASIKAVSVDSRFLGYVLLSSVGTLRSVATGSTYEAVSASQIGNLPVPYPDLPTQKAIADFLDRETARIDQLIAKKERLFAVLDERESALVSQLVTVGLDPGRPQIAQDEGWITAVPVGWSVRRIRDISTSLQTGPFGSQLHSQEYIQDGIPVVNPSHMAGGRIVHDPSVSIDIELWKHLARHALERGDIVFARRGQLGRCALVTETEVGWLCGTGSLRMRPNMTLVVSEYLIRLLSTSGVAQWLKLESVGSTMDNLNTAILGRLPLPIPPLEEQRQVTAYLEAELAQSRKIASLDKTSIDRLREFRSALITAAVTGQINVKMWGRRGETDRRIDSIQHDLEATRDEVAV